MNVTLLTSQLLSAPAIWIRPEGLRTSMRCLSVFHSAAQALVRHNDMNKNKSPDSDFSQLQLERTLPQDDWIRATISGADEQSPRWRHLLVIAGIHLGFGSAEDEILSHSMRNTLEKALVNATNLAVEETLDDDHLGLATITLVLNHCFPSLSDHMRSGLDYDALLPVLMRSTFHSVDGLRSAYFLGALDRDVQPQATQAAPNTKLNWSEQSSSFQDIRNMLASPLVGSLGPLSRLIGHSLEQVRDPRLVTAAMDEVELFSKTLLTQWRQNKLSGMEQVNQKDHLDEVTINTTLPALWKLLQTVMYASVIILRSVLGRLLGDRILASDGSELKTSTPDLLHTSPLTLLSVAPIIARQTLLILRNLYFITTHQSTSTFSQYDFVSLTAIDILTTHPTLIQTFLREIQPLTLGSTATHPLDRTLDLFFLNTSEHFTLILPPHLTAELLVPTITTYLSADVANQGPHFLPIYEAAHSVTLAIFSAPQNSLATIENLPFYVDSLFRVFPQTLSSRQFRLAFQTLLKLTSPPSELARTQPMMPAILLQLLHTRAENASTLPIPRSHSHTIISQEEEESPQLSEQAILTLTLLDTFSQIHLSLLDEWLPLTADLVDKIQDSEMREYCVEHFWKILVGGELDPERSRICHAWWSTKGGREWVLFGGRGGGERVREEVMMSGGLSRL